MHKTRVDAIVLAGYANHKMMDIVQWQLCRHPSMLNIQGYFDTNSDNTISRSEYELDKNRATAF